jgi:uncharacterized protein YggE
MRTNVILFSALAVLALALSACGPATIVANPPPPLRTLNVTGTGQVYLTPDIAYIYVGVHTERPTAAEAVSVNKSQTQQVIDSLTGAGVDAKDIRTTNFSIWPNTQYDPQTGQQIGTTYAVDNNVYVTVRKLDALGDLLDSTIQAGANSINSIQFDVADKTQALKDARTAAVKNAEAQAEELATAAGVQLGEVQSIGFFDSGPQPYLDAFGKGGGGGAAEAAAVPIQPGQLTLTVTVSMSYEIK